MINSIVIQKDKQQLSEIKSSLAKIPYLNNLALLDNYMDALRFLKNKKVDLVFIDLDIPGMNGLEFIRSLTHPPKFILTSANKDFAIQGFELDALDFLLKPFTFERFLRASEKAYDQIEGREIGQASLVEDFIMVKVEHYVNRIPMKDIFYIEGFKDYVKIHTCDSAPILTIKSLKSVEAMLPTDLFMRIHRSYIVSVNKITSYRNNKVKVKDSFLAIGDSYKHAFQQRILSEVI